MACSSSSSRAAVALLCVALAAAASQPAAAQDTIWSALHSLPSLTNFTRLIQAVPSLYNLTRDENGESTFFAPTDEAFARFFNRTKTSLSYLLTRKSDLEKLLKYHITKEGLMVSIATSNDAVTRWLTMLPQAYITLSVPEVGGSPITVNPSTANATITNPDFPAGNAYLQVIDAVLVPNNWKVPPMSSPRPSPSPRASPSPKLSPSPKPSPSPKASPSPSRSPPRSSPRSARRLVAPM